MVPCECWMRILVIVCNHDNDVSWMVRDTCQNLRCSMCSTAPNRLAHSRQGDVSWAVIVCARLGSALRARHSFFIKGEAQPDKGRVIPLTRTLAWVLSFVFDIYSLDRRSAVLDFAVRSSLVLTRVFKRVGEELSQGSHSFKLDGSRKAEVTSCNPTTAIMHSHQPFILYIVLKFDGKTVVVPCN